MKQFISLILCLLLVMSLTVPAFATETETTDAPVTPVTEGEGESTADSDESSDSPDPTPAPETQPHTHSFDAGTVTQQPTCVAEGVLTQTCSCGATQTQSVPATGTHTLGAWQNADGTNHSRSCSGCGGLTETAAHTWDGGTVTTAATCVSGGVKTFACTVCGATQTETLVANPDAHTYGNWSADKEKHSHACSGCGKVDSGAHSWAIGETVAPTCKEEGTQKYACIICGGIDVRPLSKLETHTYDNACDTDCNVCGLVRETTHKYNTAWSKNSQEHWHACTVCGHKNDLGKHYAGPAATEEKAQTCLTCGLVLTPKLNHTHKYESDWSCDDAAHWYACSGCEEEKDYAKHSFDNACDADCNVCGYRRNAAHDFGGTMESNEKGHWGTCNVCGEETDPIAHTPGPEATQTEAQTCTVCGFELAPPTVHVHKSGLNWKADNDGHWKECECGEKLETAAHSWDEGTENADTTVTYVCGDCGAEMTQGTPREARGFPWGIVLVVLILVAAGAGTALFFVLRQEKEDIFKK